MYDYLSPKEKVVDGVDEYHVVCAKDQPEYIPLGTLKSPASNGKVISRWTFTEEQRKAIADGADIFLTLYTFHNPLQPICIAVSDGNLDPDWVRVCLLDVPAKQAMKSA